MVLEEKKRKGSVPTPPHAGGRLERRLDGMKLRSSAFRYLSISCLSAGLAVGSIGCMPVKQARVAAVALTVQDVAKAAAKQSDPHIVKEGTPAFLMLLDGLLEAYPDNVDLLVAACQGYGSYASSFLPDDDRENTEAVYRRATAYGFRALAVLGGMDFEKAASGNLEELHQALQRFRKKDTGALFWTASAWAGWIGSNIGSVKAMGDLPALEAVVKRAMELDEGFHYGGPHLLLGVLLAAKPPVMGGDLTRARRHFDRAFTRGADKVLMARVLFAQYYARGTKDRALFVETLQDVVNARADEIPELTLSNTLAKEKAKLLLNRTEEYFAPQS